MKARPVKSIDADGNWLTTYVSGAAASQDLNVSRAAVCMAIRFNRRCGNVWLRYADVTDGRTPNTRTGRAAIPIRIGKRQFPSIGAAAKALGVAYSTMWLKASANPRAFRVPMSATV